MADASGSITLGMRRFLAIVATSCNFLAWLALAACVFAAMFFVLTGHPWMALIQVGSTAVAIVFLLAFAALCRLCLQLEAHTRHRERNSA